MPKKRKVSETQKALRLYYIKKGRIRSGKLNRTHLAGETADLSEWPERALETWQARGIIELVKREDGDNGASS